MRFGRGRVIADRYVEFGYILSKVPVPRETLSCAEALFRLKYFASQYIAAAWGHLSC